MNTGKFNLKFIASVVSPSFIRFLVFDFARKFRKVGYVHRITLKNTYSQVSLMQHNNHERSIMCCVDYKCKIAACRKVERNKKRLSF